MSYYSEFYARKKEAGICIWCSNPATHGIFCEECRNKRALEARELYALRSRLGVCCHCGKVDAAPGKKLCPDCLDVQRLLVAERYDPEKEKARLPKRKEVREQKKANGICIWCSKPAVRGVLCYECSIKAARNTAKQLEKKRWERRERGLVRETRAAAGLCIRCGEPREDPSKLYCSKCCEQCRQAALLANRSKWQTDEKVRRLMVLKSIEKQEGEQK